MSTRVALNPEDVAMPFASSPFPMWIYNLTTLKFLEVNEAAVKAYGFSREEFLKMTVLDIRPNHDIPRFLQSSEHPRESTAERWQHIGRDGAPFPVSITSWELEFRGQRAELVLARRESRTDGSKM